MWRRIREEANTQSEAPATKSGEEVTETKGALKFGPIDAYHLADLSILRSRVTKLLLNSPNHTHVTRDLVITLVSLSDIISLHHIHRTKGISEPDENGTPVFQHKAERID